MSSSSNITEKIIKINPELFKIQTKTKKEKQIKIKNDKTLKNYSHTNKSILKQIREKQEQIYKNIISSTKDKDPTPNSIQSDFDKSLFVLEQKIKEPHHHITKPSSHHNKSLRNNSIIIGGGNMVPITVTSNADTANSINNHLKIKPQYGCLKGGKLPTMKDIKKHSIKNNEQVNFVDQHLNKEQQLNLVEQFKLKKEKEIIDKPKKEIPTTKKKTLRRQYIIGKSKYYSKVGVLISNKTLRTQTIEKTQNLKEKPISEIKNTLIKKGLIKIGTTAPNDVLRKMYESVSLVAGEVQNHNVDNLLYNYLHT